MNWDRWGRLARWMLTCLVFFALPFLLIAFGFGNRWRVQELEARDQAFAGLDAALLTIRKHEDPEKFFSSLIKRLLFLAGRRRNAAGVLRRGMQSIHGRFPGLFHFTVLGASGDVIEDLSEGKPPKAVLRRLVKALQSPDPDDRKKALEDKWSMFRSYLGPSAEPNDLAERIGEFVEVSMTKSKRHFGYFPAAGLTIMAHLDHPDDWELISARDQCARFRRFSREPDLTVGLVDLVGAGVVPIEVRSALEEFNQTSRQNILDSDRLFSIMGFSTTARLWAWRPLGSVLSLDGYRRLLAITGTLLFAVLSLGAFAVMVGGRSFTLPIRWRLIVLFFFASGLPLAVVILAGWDYLHQKYRSRVRQAHDECERSLRAFDSRFPQMRETIQKKLSGIMDRQNYETPTGKRRLEKLFSAGRSFIQRAVTLLYGNDGKIVWKNDARITAAKSNEGHKVMGELSGQVLARLNNEEFTGQKSAASSFLSNFKMRETGPINQMTREIGKIIDFSMAGNQNWTFFYPIKSALGRATHMVFATWGKSDLERLYIERNLISEQRHLSGGRLVAFAASGDWMFPKDERLRGKLKDLLEDLRLRQGTAIGETEIGPEGYLVTGIKPKELPGTFLVTLVPNRPILTEIRNLRWALWAFSLVSALTSVVLGVILSRRFLVPIRDLSSGVQAIQLRDFQHRLPPGEQDELGDLAATFNRVMEGLSDLEVGRIVQESLFPQEPVVSGPYRLFGATSSASELGGDYFDYHSLPDGRLLFLIGDVSGHGVPSALVMAMAKALVERECELEPDPEILLKTIHLIFFRTLKRRRMMSCFLAILDPAAHVLSFANAGHNYPYLFHVGGKAETLVSQSVPLGSRKNITLEPKSISIAPGDHLLLYTDGLIEAKTLTGEEVGYERMADSVQPLLDEDPQESLRRVYAWHRGITRAGAQEDDITLVLLCRAAETAG